VTGATTPDQINTDALLQSRDYFNQSADLTASSGGQSQPSNEAGVFRSTFTIPRSGNDVANRRGANAASNGFNPGMTQTLESDRVLTDAYADSLEMTGGSSYRNQYSAEEDYGTGSGGQEGKVGVRGNNGTGRGGDDGSRRMMSVTIPSLGVDDDDFVSGEDQEEDEVYSVDESFN